MTALAKARDEVRYSLSPMYIPGVDNLDAHGEFATADDLQKGLWSLIRSGDRRIRLQHDTSIVAGELVEAVSWPYETEVDLTVPGEPTRKAVMPAGTVFNGVIWSEWAWPLVKSGRLRGLSMGGRAKRVEVEFDELGSQVAKSIHTRSTPAPLALATLEDQDRKSLASLVAKGLALLDVDRPSVAPHLTAATERVLARKVGEEIFKHGTHDQKTHGRGRGKRADGGGDSGGGGSDSSNPFGYASYDPRRKDKAYGSYSRQLEEKLNSGMEKHGDSLSANTDENGQLTPERKAMHDEIISEMMAGLEGVPKNREAVIMAGPPGAGKSTTLRKHGAKLGLDVDQKSGEAKNAATVNPDDLKEKLIEKGGLPDWVEKSGIAPAEAATVLHQESSMLSKRFRAEVISAGYNVVLDGTLSGKTAKQVNKARTLIDQGYKVKTALVDGDVELAVTRAAQRHRQGKSEPPYEGRYVAYNLITGQGNLHGNLSSTTPWGGGTHKTQNSQNFAEVAKIAQSAYVFDTSGNIVAQAEGGNWK